MKGLVSNIYNNDHNSNDILSSYQIFNVNKYIYVSLNHYLFTNSNAVKHKTLYAPRALLNVYALGQLKTLGRPENDESSSRTLAREMDIVRWA
jgi:hypothetical protein